VLGVFVPELKRMVDETREKVLQGRNWDYDKDKTKRELAAEEEREKAQRPPKVKTVTRHQITELSDYLVERLRRIELGELYVVDGCQPPQTSHEYTIDTAVMLIALSDCLNDTETAVSAIREIMWEVGKKAAPKAIAGKTKADLSLDLQVEMLIMWKKDCVLTGVLIAAAYLIFDIEPTEGDKQQARLVGQIGAQLLKYAWHVFATTKNVFGWNLNPKEFDKL
jgi:hypothetical protein